MTGWRGRRIIILDKVDMTWHDSIKISNIALRIILSSFSIGLPFSLKLLYAHWSVCRTFENLNNHLWIYGFTIIWIVIVIVIVSRVIQRSQTDLSDPENSRLRVEEEKLSLLVCTACYQPFSLLYRRRLVCHSCLLGVCRACASFSTTSTLWTCTRCQDRRWVMVWSGWWYCHTLRIKGVKQHKFSQILYHKS